MTTKFVKILAVAVMGLAVIAAAAGAEKGTGPRGLSRVLGSPVNTYLDVNNISTVFWDQGYADIDVQDLNAGFVFPKGSGKTAVFQSGFLWGGIVNGEVRVGGSAYRSGLQTGKILSVGVPEDPNLPKNRIYRIRPDYRTGDVSSEVRDEGKSAAEIRAQYALDWNEWPVADGAPYTDVDSNGVYDPTVDIPGVPGADMTVYFISNDLNAGNTTFLYGSNPIGIELQTTIWAYSQQGALGNMFFKRYLMINKSTSTVDSMYVTQWADCDDGDATDDFTGCDTTLSVFYTYNAFATDAVYNPLPPPCVGFDFFQGPVVDSPGDSAIFRGHRIYDKRNLPMTASYYFARGDATVTDPTQGSYEGTLQFYNFMKGRIGRTGQIFTDPHGRQTTFALDGDPVAGTGWIDGQILPAGDRRNGGASGPFTFAPGDTQEVVVAEIAAGAIPGVNRLAAISLMKFFDQSAQLAYDNFFTVPSAPPPPKVTVTETDHEVIFTWGNDPVAVEATETSNNAGFRFQGYNVYQLPSASATLDQATRIATYDIVDGVTVILDKFFDALNGVLTTRVAQVGKDTGIKRSLSVTADALKGNTPLINGIRYYFAITAYSYNSSPTAVPNNLENPLKIITVVPHSPNPGVRYQGVAGDTIPVQHTALAGGRVSDGTATPIIIDPAQLTGQNYAVNFSTDTTSGNVTWRVTNTTTNTVLLNNQTNQSGDANYLFTDGFQVVVAGPPPGMKDWDIPAGARRWTWANADGFGLEGFNGAMGMGYNSWFSSSSVTPVNLHDVLIKLAATDVNGNLLDPNDTTASFGYRYLRRATFPPARPEFAPFIVNPSAGYAYQDYHKHVPFAAYDEATNQRLMVGWLENNVAEGLVDGKYWPPANDDPVRTQNNGAAEGAREFFFIFSVPYSETPDAALQDDISNVTMPLMWYGTPDRRGNVAFQAGDEFEILANHPNADADVFSFQAPGVINDPALAKQDINAINVFPNPYYGVNTEELNKYQRFVTFTHLPANATIRIFNLAGILVRTINHTPTAAGVSQFERWDLCNEAGLPAGSGLYIAHIEMPDLGGATKILKIAVVQEQQILDRF